MSGDIGFDQVRRGVAQFGDRATVITVSDAGAPHVVTSLIEVGDDRLIATVGSHTRDHLRRRPAVTLLWDAVSGGEYQLILDGVAERVDDPDERALSTVSIEVTRGILHRLAGLPNGGPTCRAVGGDEP